MNLGESRDAKEGKQIFVLINFPELDFRLLSLSHLDFMHRLMYKSEKRLGNLLWSNKSLFRFKNIYFLGFIVVISTCIGLVKGGN